ncbi:helix-hairpin-helix DNA-binding motif-containing protein [Pandoraea communis]|uniref:Helix-hairpin-helix DNA-binding motif-containing protein n=1 Tax=Pandoraea communis TaxID=2508297 RepID=A0A5E4S5J7_9BURK|nr:helix-turn-helix domain-containing protein [Pandoraea communis]VVD71056.1 helix-hairpin-helix DNA-binding motif-containing protein [Pandoraea communis]
MQTNPLALFGDHLARLRKARGWSQEKLALESGLARSYVSGIERGRRNVALVNICVLADTLGVPTSEMLRFAQAASGAEDGTAPSDHTPVPQISRFLCRLENRDQVWLAEIIRSLSARLSHAASPGGARAGSNTPAASPAARDDLAGEDEDLEEADDADVGSPAFSRVSERTVIDRGFPAHHHFAAPSEDSYRVDDDEGEPADTATHIREPERASFGDTDASGESTGAHRSDAIAREESRRFPNDDEE